MQSTSHTTSGTARRAAHTLSGEALTFQFADEIAELRQDLTRSSGQRSAKTLAKMGGLRLTLVYLEKDATMMPEATEGGATVQVIEGRLRIQSDGTQHDIGPGQLIVLENNLRQPIRAAERSAFLITVLWPEGAGAWAQEEAAGRL